MSLKKLADARIQLGSLTQKKLVFDETTARRNDLLHKILKTWEVSQSDEQDTFTEEGIDFIIFILV